MTKILLNLVGMGCLAFILAGCDHAIPESRAVVNKPDRVERADTPVKGLETGKLEPAGLSDLPQPVNELADGEYAWSQLLARDAIRPIYENEVEFVEGQHAPYADDELVIGLEINGEAKAYAIGPLNSREMVNDTVGGVPVLVTW